ncbi:hypothetical protein LOZ12_001150 [Ophidiomyces ophidiicola]|uniref:Uncharacterized protein n=1 Tax=Ophidiomyces ophidiicola TaxID=1387563 RepID=A0ACB8V288_9EURO|nr:hypothetical protein LOZ64_001675 [Ophidiomyces ophidiicola]KAI1954499.1 hypothetical protein LOZ62_000793 [Ophidiomyces ophidiicola]KAI1961813.1 hypothetical protein LOZ59_002252 [Ophidiomyces ophidiicola]KAI1974485.1 hypothetical protein LOZ56_001228 [Ophidiomyces ophidiicola]KAI2008907.1 hypothetical protein LOZ50_001826 [Ophidiomyces ophidiicola]
MRSNLTRGIFQAIVENKPYIHSQCYRQIAPRISSRSSQKCSPHITQRRTAFSFPIPQATDVKTHSENNGAKQMMELVNALKQKVQPPPPFILAKAFLAFIKDREETMMVLTQNQVRFLLQTFEHLAASYPYEDSKGSVRAVLSLNHLENAMMVLSRVGCESDAAELLNKLSKLIYAQMCLRANTTKPPQQFSGTEALRSYISILGPTGSALEALDILETHWKSILHVDGISPWVDVINGIAKEGRSSEISMIVEKMNEHAIKLDPASHEEILRLLATENSIDALKIFYSIMLPDNLQPTVVSTATAIIAALRNSMVDWANSLSKLLPEYPTPETRDANLLLAAARGENVSTIDEILKFMVERNPEVEQSMTASTFNALIEYANIIKRPDLVNDYVELGRRWNIQPDAETYMLQVDSKLQEGDIYGAVALSKDLKRNGLISHADAVILNRILKQLCLSPHADADFDTILSFVDRLVETNCRFEAETLKSLCEVLLYREELGSISNLLRPIINEYNSGDLSKISGAFVKYICDKSVSTESAWEAYELLNMAFPNTPVWIRTDIMTQFFDRGQSKLACLVFGHMRQKESGGLRPTAHTYSLCFQGISRAADAKGLHLVHNMLRLDLEVGLTTKILNGLMLSYATCGMPDQAMDYFRDILHSDEGPSEATLMIFFRACETYYNGVEESRKMVEKLRSMGIQIDGRIYNAYIGALAGHCEIERATELIKSMESSIGVKPTSLTLGTLYNALPYQYWKDQAEEWAQATYPDTWHDLEQLGSEVDHEGLKLFNIDRNIEV